MDELDDLKGLFQPQWFYDLTKAAVQLSLQETLPTWKHKPQKSGLWSWASGKCWGKL